MTKRSSDPWVVYPKVKVQVRELSMRVVGIDFPFAPRGVSIRGKFDLCQVLPAAVRHGRARQISGPEPCGDFGRVLWVPGPRCQYSGKIRFIKKPGVQD